MTRTDLDKAYIREIEGRAATQAICMIAIRDWLQEALQVAGTAPTVELDSADVMEMVENLNLGIYPSGKRPD